MAATRYTAAAAVAAFALLAAPAGAQKAEDTLRIGFMDPIASVEIIQDPKPETGLTGRSVFDTLIVFDPESGSYKPLLAKSWKRVDDVTLEFELRDDVRWHDGTPFTADDVVYTFNWLADPDVTLRFKTNFDWLARAEKIDSHRVRVIAKQPYAVDMARIALSFEVYPEHIHSKFENKADFGRRNPVGTGPYKVAYVDPDKGVLLERNENYNHGGPWRPAASIGRVHALPIPDMQTQIAQMMTGGLDVIHNVTPDQVEAMTANPDITSTALLGIVYYYMSMDAADRSGFGAFKDQRVRQAMMMAVDRDELIRHIVSGADMEDARLDGLCIKGLQVGCDYTTAPPAFNLERARSLLAEAGYGDGFDLEITTLPGAYEVAEAVSGQLRRIGVRATVDRRTMGAYRQKQTAGEIQMLVAHWSSGGLPDASGTMNFFFSKTGRDYWRDDQIDALRGKAEVELDEEKRMDLYRQAYDRANEMNYILPIARRPVVFLHTEEVTIPRPTLDPIGVDALSFSWAD